MPRFILIDNIENLNKNSINSLLKVIEEPNENVFFILINNSGKFLLQTLKSRCLSFKINFTFDESIGISNQIFGSNIFDKINIDLINYYNTPGEIIDLINFSNEKNINLTSHTLINFLNLMIDNKYYKRLLHNSGIPPMD
jgi:DNA polymerase-3 subunit delta'